MSVTPIRPIASDSQVPIIPVIMFDKEEADAAFAVHAELSIAEVNFPLLAECPAFRARRFAAYQRFYNAFTAGV